MHQPVTQQTAHGEHGDWRQDKTRQDKTRQDKTRQDTNKTRRETTCKAGHEPGDAQEGKTATERHGQHHRAELARTPRHLHHDMQSKHLIMEEQQRRSADQRELTDSARGHLVQVSRLDGGAHGAVARHEAEVEAVAGVAGPRMVQPDHARTRTRRQIDWTRRRPSTHRTTAADHAGKRPNPGMLTARS